MPKRKLSQYIASFQRFVDGFIGLLKWPVAVMCVVLLPGTLITSIQLLAEIVKHLGPSLAFLIGFGLYTVLWWGLFRKWKSSWLSTFEHEFTHAIFAWATFHRVVELRATWSRGGHIRYYGKGNWLITISPYFFPTASLMLLIVFVFLPDRWGAWIDPLLGVTLGYHIWSTMRETHGGQTDLKKVGRPFAFMFLPTATIVTHGMVVAYAHDGRGAVWPFIAQVWNESRRIVGFG